MVIQARGPLPRATLLVAREAQVVATLDAGFASYLAKLCATGDLMMVLGEGSEKSQPIRLGRALLRVRERVFGQHRVESMTDPRDQLTRLPAREGQRGDRASTGRPGTLRNVGLTCRATCRSVSHWNPVGLRHVRHVGMSGGPVTVASFSMVGHAYSRRDRRRQS